MIPKNVLDSVSGLISNYEPARVVFQALRERKRPRKDIDTYRLRNEVIRGGRCLEIEDVRHVFTVLEVLGCGHLEKRSLPDHDVFHSKYTLTVMAKLLAS